MAKRHAVLMKLRKDVTRGEVRELARLLDAIGDPAWLDAHKHYAAKDAPTGINTYDDKYGDPVFYIP